MKVGHKRPQFRLIAIDAFDARRGYKRCSHPGVELYGLNATADFWRDKTKRLVLRFSCHGYVFHFAASLASGGQIPDDRLDAFDSYVSDVLAEWLSEGEDDYPNSIWEV